MNLPVQRIEWLQQLGEFFCGDLCLNERADSSSEASEDSVTSVAADFMAEKNKFPLVYTAFDGDHQELCAFMRLYALRRGYVPVNPDSVLGYKETIEARYNKADVLRDDLAVLRGCEELWVFTDCEPTPSGIRGLAEGVLVELVFFVKRHPRGPVKFVSIKRLLRGDPDEPRDFRIALGDLLSCLPNGSANSILAIANGGLLADHPIPPLYYFIIDPLDFKYCRFLREYGYNLSSDKKTAPIVPNLAIEITALGPGAAAAGQIVACWARLMDIAAECYGYPSMEARASRSKVAIFLEYVWRQNTRGASFHKGIWSNHNIPKAKLADGWPITQLEKQKIRRGDRL